MEKRNVFLAVYRQYGTKWGCKREVTTARLDKKTFPISDL